MKALLFALSIYVGIFGTNEDMKKLNNLIDEQITIIEKIQEVKKDEVTLNIPMELIEVNENGYFFKDKNSKFQQVYVDFETIKDYGMQNIKVGNKVIGIFHSNGWELLALEKLN